MPTILLVDDEPCVRAVLSAMLTRGGYRVIEQENARDAIKCVSADSNLDLAVVDVILPDGCVRDVAGAIEHTQPSLPILLISGLDVASLQFGGLLDIRLLARSNVSFRQKPFTYHELKRIVKALLVPATARRAPSAAPFEALSRLRTPLAGRPPWREAATPAYTGMEAAVRAARLT